VSIFEFANFTAIRNSFKRCVISRTVTNLPLNSEEAGDEKEAPGRERVSKRAFWNKDVEICVTVNPTAFKIPPRSRDQSCSQHFTPKAPMPCMSTTISPLFHTFMCNGLIAKIKRTTVNHHFSSGCATLMVLLLRNSSTFLSSILSISLSCCLLSTAAASEESSHFFSPIPTAFITVCGSCEACS